MAAGRSLDLKELLSSGDSPSQPNETSNIYTLACEVPREPSPDLEADIHAVLHSHSTELTERDLEQLTALSKSGALRWQITVDLELTISLQGASNLSSSCRLSHHHTWSCIRRLSPSRSHTQAVQST